MMSRRGLLASMLLAPVATAAPRVDCLVLGDSIARQLAPRLASRIKPIGKRIGLDARAGESANNFLRRNWWREAVERYAPCPVVASLGVNCVKQERTKLAETVATLDELAGWRTIWIVPHRDGYAFDLDYLYEALAAAGVAALWLPRLPLEADRVHPTDAAHRRIAEIVTKRIWP